MAGENRDCSSGRDELEQVARGLEEGVYRVRLRAEESKSGSIWGRLLDKAVIEIGVFLIQIPRLRRRRPGKTVLVPSRKV